MTITFAYFFFCVPRMFIKFIIPLRSKNLNLAKETVSRDTADTFFTCMGRSRYGKVTLYIFLKYCKDVPAAELKMLYFYHFISPHSSWVVGLVVKVPTSNSPFSPTVYPGLQVSTPNQQTIAVSGGVSLP